MMTAEDFDKHALSFTLLAVVAATVTLGVFQAFPGIDLATAKLFCHAYAAGDLTAMGRYCPGFPAQTNPAIGVIRKILFYLPPLVAACLALDIARRWATTPPWLCRGYRLEALAALAYLVGPIGLVNGVFKQYSGRPRPYETHLFGGDLHFVSVADFSGACISNCSFVSGEAAAGGWLFGVALLLRMRHPRLGRLLMAASVITPFIRLAMGGHYLSDVVLGWLAGAISLPLLILTANGLRGALQQVIKSRT
jgi:membrane-associated phospholipid phosphatase